VDDYQLQLIFRAGFV